MRQSKISSNTAPTLKLLPMSLTNINWYIWSSLIESKKMLTSKWSWEFITFCSCKEAVKSIFNVLKIDNSKSLWQLVQLIEMCSKNTNVLFHKCLSTDAFVEAFLASLKRVRGKHKVVATLEKKDAKIRWSKAENQLLGLIQIWADTFMMREDDFPGF